MGFGRSRWLYWCLGTSRPLFAGLCKHPPQGDRMCGDVWNESVHHTDLEQELLVGF